MSECTEKARLQTIEKRLGSGDVVLATLDLKMTNLGDLMAKVHEQTKRTNGRVNKLELDALKGSFTWKHVIRDLVGVAMTVGGLAAVLVRTLGD